MDISSHFKADFMERVACTKSTCALAKVIGVSVPVLKNKIQHHDISDYEIDLAMAFLGYLGQEASPNV